MDRREGRVRVGSQWAGLGSVQVGYARGSVTVVYETHHHHWRGYSPGAAARWVVRMLVRVARRKARAWRGQG